MNNLLSYWGLTDSRIKALNTDYLYIEIKVIFSWDGLNMFYTFYKYALSISSDFWIKLISPFYKLYMNFAWTRIFYLNFLYKGH